MGNGRDGTHLMIPAPLRAWIVPLLVLLCLQTTFLGITLAATAAETTVPVKLAAAPAETGHMTSAQCLACHQTQQVLSHPVSFAPPPTRAALPAAFPLDNGMMQCTTCHLDSIAEHSRRQGSLLRGTQTGQAFCTQCHADGTLSRQSQHALALTKAHLQWPSAAKTSANTAANTGDDGIRSCLGCHDGAIAPDAFAGMLTSTGKSFDGKSLKDHPVGMAFPSLDSAFRPASSLDPRVRLTGGLVTCNSCHSLYAAQPALLVRKNTDSALCASCHVN